MSWIILKVKILSIYFLNYWISRIQTQNSLKINYKCWESNHLKDKILKTISNENENASSQKINKNIIIENISIFLLIINYISSWL